MECPVTKTYIYTDEKDISLFLEVILGKEGIEFHSCNSFKKLQDLCKSCVPHIFILDDKNISEEDVFTILDYYYEYSVNTMTAVVLLSKRNENKYKIDCILRCVDYFLKHPVNIVELIARIYFIIQQQQRMRKRIEYERNTSFVDTMENISTYLMNNVKKPIQKFIDFDVNLSDIELLKKYVCVSKNGAASVMAAVNAIRDELNQIVCSHNEKGEEGKMSSQLDDLYKKNLSIISAAYNLDRLGVDT